MDRLYDNTDPIDTLWLLCYGEFPAVRAVYANRDLAIKSMDYVNTYGVDTHYIIKVDLLDWRIDVETYPA